MQNYNFHLSLIVYLCSFVLCTFRDFAHPFVWFVPVYCGQSLKDECKALRRPFRFFPWWVNYIFRLAYWFGYLKAHIFDPLLSCFSSWGSTLERREGEREKAFSQLWGQLWRNGSKPVNDSDVVASMHFFSCVVWYKKMIILKKKCCFSLSVELGFR